MKASVKPIAPRFLRANETHAVLGSKQVTVDCEAAGWLTPVHRRHRLTLYRFADVHVCADRIEAGEYPEKSAGTANNGSHAK